MTPAGKQLKKAPARKTELIKGGWFVIVRDKRYLWDMKSATSAFVLNAWWLSLQLTIL